MRLDIDAKGLFSSYMKLVGVPELAAEPTDEPALYGKKLGLVNGSAWIQLWSYYFGRLHLPGVKLINVGNEATQLNFMQAHAQHLECPPRKNIEVFANYARDLVELYGADAIMVTCSTMNRSFPAVQAAVAGYGVPVIQIDQPMMERAVKNGGRTLIIATHGPTVNSTRMLLEETAVSVKGVKPLEYCGATVEEAFHLLGEGKIDEHNELIARAIREAQQADGLDQVVLAQLSMSVFRLTYPEPEAVFDVPVLTSGDEGFRRVRELFTNRC